MVSFDVRCQSGIFGNILDMHIDNVCDSDYYEPKYYVAKIILQCCPNTNYMVAFMGMVLEVIDFLVDLYYYILST